MLIPALLMGSSFLAGLSKRKAAGDTADAYDENASASKAQGYFQERGMRLEQGALLSQIRNRAGAAGVDVNSGSPLEAYLQAARETELDIFNARYNAGREADAYQSRATSLRKAGDQALFGSMLEGAASVMSFQGKKNSYEFKPSTVKPGNKG